MDAKASLKLTLNALDSATAHIPSDALKQCIRHRRSRMAKALPSLHYEMPTGENWIEIFPGDFGQEARNMIGRIGE